jgi:SAM-dependent methyltransferase
MTQPLYWFGNAAKMRIVSEIVAQTSTSDHDIVIFDYGCGKGGDWPQILADNPNLTLIGYDPSLQAVAEARARCRGQRATFYEGEEIGEIKCQADYIVSFSVLEHVRDRRAYLETAYALLAAAGRFYLNYDDGHFRRPEAVEGFAPAFAELIHETRRIAWRAFGGEARTTNYKQRVNRRQIDGLIAACGYDVESMFYSNIVSMKRLAKTIPEEGRAAFASLWLSLESKLNADFCLQTAEMFEDDANLWRVMPSRTLVLRKGKRQPSAR